MGHPSAVHFVHFVHGVHMVHSMDAMDTMDEMDLRLKKNRRPLRGGDSE
jgi:hypothetical protein